MKCPKLLLCESYRLLEDPHQLIATGLFKYHKLPISQVPNKRARKSSQNSPSLLPRLNFEN